LAAVYDTLGRHEDAEPLFLGAVTVFRDQLGESHPLTQRAAELLATHYRSRGMDELADQWEAGDP
ncbi:MAG: tetratricopeptide repeat protein, partial [Phycisphaerales bacterium]|nr:tetratricopeptide repeat protein [Phycisphaerales bacterium]